MAELRWNPPETAPKDRAFLITTAGPNFDLCFWDKEAECFRDYFHKQKIVNKWPQMVAWADVKCAKVGNTEIESRVANDFYPAHFVYIPRQEQAYGGKNYKREQDALRRWCKKHLSSLRPKIGCHGSIDGVQGRYVGGMYDRLPCWRIVLQGPTAEKDAILLSLQWSDGFRP